MNFVTAKPMQKNIIFFGAMSLVIKAAFVIVLAQATLANAAPAPQSFADLADKLLPTVVNISSTQKIEEMPQARRHPFGQNPAFPQFPEGHPFNDLFNDFFGDQFQMMPGMPQMRRMPATSLGSGFILDKEKGLIITNNHVIADADEIKITLHDDTIIPAEIIGTDEKTDIAVLKADLSDEDVTNASFGNSDAMRVGDWVIAIGNPFGLGGTVTAGIISARQRDINSGPYDDYLQTDASINRGNSGGPMFNMAGEVIGINTAIFSPTGGSVGIGFAIPSAIAEPVISQINEFGRTRRGWLGVKIQQVTDEIADSLGLDTARGALVAEVNSDGPAKAAGIEAGDIILSFNGKPIDEMRNLPRIVADTDINTDVPVTVWRNEKQVQLTANIGELEKAEEDGLLAEHGGNNIFNGTVQTEPEGEEIPALGLNLKALDPQTRGMFDIDSDVNGLVVMDSDPNADAARKGIDAGDVILEVNQKPVTSIEALNAEIEAAKTSGREAILLQVNRQGSIQFVAVKLSDEAPEEDEE
jgi:serine protease Do